MGRYWRWRSIPSVAAGDDGQHPRPEFIGIAQKGAAILILTGTGVERRAEQPQHGSAAGGSQLCGR